MSPNTHDISILVFEMTSGDILGIENKNRNCVKWFVCKLMRDAVIVGTTTRTNLFTNFNAVHNIIGLNDMIDTYLLHCPLTRIKRWFSMVVCGWKHNNVWLNSAVSSPFISLEQNASSVLATYHFVNSSFVGGARCSIGRLNIDLFGKIPTP